MAPDSSPCGHPGNSPNQGNAAARSQSPERVRIGRVEDGSLQSGRVGRSGVGESRRIGEKLERTGGRFVNRGIEVGRAWSERVLGF